MIRLGDLSSWLLIELQRLVNAFAYWQGQKITNATATYLDDLQQAIGHIQELSGSIDGIEIWNGETGWPADGVCTPSDRLL